ncbi:hypothetical protein BL253_12060 [Pseudofrankia asymbiotica]|uniref:DUF2889 domain-containing protein n=2 Tax=Pseudofrankia asymbiotica TaxID=1834516 RepID=A0A1V2ID20_9ACTN|nr:hypothetical protein BL253_12060 [Pseudofrankia asymbiotica]
MTGPASPTGPALSTPPPRPGLVRRTTTHDSLRRSGVERPSELQGHSGLSGPVTLDARGRDVRVEADGALTVLDAARLDAEIDFPRREITRIGSDPGEPRLAALVGVRAASGFRQAVHAALPDERASHSVRFQLLDDLPTAVLVSGYATQWVEPGPFPQWRQGMASQYPDLCAGWVAGGTIIQGIEATGRVPAPFGPPVPPIEGDDPRGWHEVAPLPAHGMRRRRRLDVWRDGAEARVECFFRDSHVDPDGVETAVHEYTVHATLDPATTTFTSCTAEFGALPWPECPLALASAGRLVGQRPDGLRREVRDSFTGVTTCTHLNDTLRSLEDVGALLARLPGETAP